AGGQHLHEWIDQTRGAHHLLHDVVRMFLFVRGRRAIPNTHWRDTRLDLPEQIVHLRAGGQHLHEWIDQTRGAHHLLHDVVRMFLFVRGR
ncbi:hypothetical protein CTI14_64940, partial [Methylobacterium radiotolerans]